MAAIQNQQLSLLKFVSINDIEITNHGRTFSSIETLNVSDVETGSGRIRRFYKSNRKVITFNFTYLPGPPEKTVDGRVGRDFIFNLAMSSPYVVVEYKDSPVSASVVFNGFITNYTESIVRRDLRSQCTYYDVQFEVEEQ